MFRIHGHKSAGTAAARVWLGDVMHEMDAVSIVVNIMLDPEKSAEWDFVKVTNDSGREVFSVSHGGGVTFACKDNPHGCLNAIQILLMYRAERYVRFGSCRAGKPEQVHNAERTGSTGF